MRTADGDDDEGGQRERPLPARSCRRVACRHPGRDWRRVSGIRSCSWRAITSLPGIRALTARRRRSTGRERASPGCTRRGSRCTTGWPTATVSCACTTSRLSATPAEKRSVRLRERLMRRGRRCCARRPRGPPTTSGSGRPCGPRRRSALQVGQLRAAPLEHGVGERACPRARARPGRWEHSRPLPPRTFRARCRSSGCRCRRSCRPRRATDIGRRRPPGGTARPREPATGRCEIVRPRRARLGERLVQAQGRHRGVGNGVRQLERLPAGQADDARQRELVDGELVLGGDEPLLLRLQLHAPAQHVDVGDDTRRFWSAARWWRTSAVFTWARMDSTAAASEITQQVGVARREHDELARVLVGELARRLLGLRGGPPALDLRPVEDLLGEVAPGIGHGERPHDGRDVAAGIVTLKPSARRLICWRRR